MIPYLPRKNLKNAADRQRAEWDEEQKTKQMVAWLEQGEQQMKLNTDAVNVLSLDIDNIEIVVDEDDPTRIEIYILDELGDRIEGGTFSKDAFMQHVRRFYEAEY